MNINLLKRVEGYDLYYVDEISSTNSYLKTEYMNYQDNTILWAGKQTNGRGRYDRKWESKDDLTFSILLKEKYNTAIITPLSIVLALNDYGVNAKIKWPNDLYLHGSKLAGILIEDEYEDDFLASIVGIGINMNDYPGLNGIGIGEFINDKEELIARIMKYFNYLKGINMNTIINIYREYSNVIGKKVIYQGEEYLVNTIDKDGHLVLTNDNGTKTISTDEISIKDALLDFEF